MKPKDPAAKEPAVNTPADEKSADPGEGEPDANGMMAGVTPGAKTPDDEKKKMLPVTTFGRYIKILLSSNEFIFVS